MEALPYYKWHWQDWRANRRVQRMPWQAKGPYRELLDELWAEGSLPADLASLADIVGCTEAELGELWPHIGTCFQERGGRLYNAKMDAQRTASDAARIAMIEGGRAGGKVSNSFTRAKGEEAYPKPTLTQPQAMPDIEEKTRLEKIREEKNTLAQTSHSESAPDRGKALGTIPCNGNPKQFTFYEQHVREWTEAFPAVDVMQQLRECRQWNVDNPGKRKTAKGMRRFINSWLSREQDKPHSGVLQMPSSSQQPNAYQLKMARIREESGAVNA